MLYAVGDYTNPDGMVTHFIHVVKANGTEWCDYINFRNYLNANPETAKEYEALKIRLAGENQHGPGREKYLAGKHDFIANTIKAANTWAAKGNNDTN